MEEPIVQIITDVIRKELAPIKLDIAETKADVKALEETTASIKLDILVIKKEMRLTNRRIRKLELELHEHKAANENLYDDIGAIIENIKNATENRKLIENHEQRIQVLEAV